VKEKKDLTKGKVVAEEEGKKLPEGFKVEKSEIGKGFSLYRETYENDEKLNRLRRF